MQTHTVASKTNSGDMMMMWLLLLASPNVVDIRDKQKHANKKHATN